MYFIANLLFFYIQNDIIVLQIKIRLFREVIYMKKIIILFSILFLFGLFYFSPKALAFEIIPDIGDDYQSEDEITIKTSSVLGRPRYVTESYDSSTRIKKRLYRYNVYADMILDCGVFYEAGDGKSLSESTTFEKTYSSETLISTSMTNSVSSSFSSEIGVDGIGKTGASATVSSTFGSAYGISESRSFTKSTTKMLTVSADAPYGYYRLEARTKCVVYYVVEYLYNSPTKCWLKDSYYIFDASDEYYVAQKRYLWCGGRYIYDDRKDPNCFYLSYAYIVSDK